VGKESTGVGGGREKVPTGNGGRQGKDAHGQWWEAGNSSPEFPKKN